MVGLGVALLERLRQVTHGEHGMLRWYLDLDDEALAHALGGRDGVIKLPHGWRELVGQALDYERYRLTNLPKWHAYRELLSGMADIEAGGQPLVRNILDQSGADELATAIDAGAIRVADLGLSMSNLYRPHAKMDSESDNNIRAWVGLIAERMRDRTYRMVFDADSAALMAELAAMGRLNFDEQGSKLTAQGSLGAGLVARLPALPEASMDELLDLRKELRGPVVRYQAAVMRYSRDIPANLVPGPELNFEIQQIYEAAVKPAIADIEERMATSGLVRDWASHLGFKDLTLFLGSTSVLTMLGSAHSIGTLTSSAIGAALSGTPLMAQAAQDTLRDRREASSAVSGHDLYLLYHANRIAPGRN